MPVSIVKDPSGRGWRLREPSGKLLPKKYPSYEKALAAQRARNRATEGHG